MRFTVRCDSMRVLCILLAATSVALAGSNARAQASPAPAPAAVPATAKGIAGTWQGTLHAGKDLRLVLKITEAPGGKLTSIFYSVDQGGQPLPVKTTTFAGSELRLAIEAIDGTYEGKLSGDGTTLTGTWKQGDNPLPLILLRATPDTAWTIPAPPPRLPPMAADANPSFEVATIKPSNPDQQGKGFRVQGRRFTTLNTTFDDLAEFAYGIQSKQLVGGPDWLATDKFDLAAEPDGEGAPSDRQWKGMIRKLLADRFQFKFHPDKKELSAYVLTVAKGGPKMTRAAADAGGLPGLFFTKLGSLTVRNATMADFAGLMQSAVFDRPVVDHTGLTGRWDFLLKWTPDESQFSSFGVKIPPPTDAVDAPPPVFTAIQEQAGLRLESEKTQVDVMAIDHVQKPGAN